MKCVRMDLTKECDTYWRWSDKGSGADKDVTVFMSEDSKVQGMAAKGWYTSSYPRVRCLIY